MSEWTSVRQLGSIPVVSLNDPLNAAVRKRAGELFKHDRKMAFQRAIRDAYMETVGGKPYETLLGACVNAISKEQAESLILRYEWLGSLGRARAFYGLFISNDLIGCVCFGMPSGVKAGDVCGEELRSKAICLIRGCCTHLAPKNSASYLISEACRLAMMEHGWQIFYAYADAEAGEIGNVYQACNWFYIGQGVGRAPGRMREEWVLPDGKQVSNRYLRHRGMVISDALALGWKRVFTLPKHKYVWFEGDRRQRRALKARCRYPFLPYPKNRLRPPSSH